MSNFKTLVLFFSFITLAPALTFGQYKGVCLVNQTSEEIELKRRWCGSGKCMPWKTVLLPAGKSMRTTVNRVKAKDFALKFEPVHLLDEEVCVRIIWKVPVDLGIQLDRIILSVSRRYGRL